MTAPETPMVPADGKPPLDDRVRANGKPVSRLTVKRKDYGGWFVIRRPRGLEAPEGVVLEIRIPGCHEDRPFADQADALVGADAIYGEYCQAVEALAG
jgi:hypothetical protein